MVLGPKLRNDVYVGLEPIIGKEAVIAMLSHFPADPRLEPATNHALELFRGEVREGFQLVRAEIHTEVASLRNEMTTGLSDLRTEMTTGLSDLRTEMTTGLSVLHSEMTTGLSDLRTEMATGLSVLHSEMTTGLSDLRTEMATGLSDLHSNLTQQQIQIERLTSIVESQPMQLQTEMSRLFQRQTAWLVGVMIAFGGLFFATAALLR